MGFRFHRVINDEPFRQAAFLSTKAKAKRRAQTFRRQGVKARVFKLREGWGVYVGPFRSRLVTPRGAFPGLGHRRKFGGQSFSKFHPGRFQSKESARELAKLLRAGVPGERRPGKARVVKVGKFWAVYARGR